MKTECCGRGLARLKETLRGVVHRCLVCGKKYNTNLSVAKVKLREREMGAEVTR